MDGRMDERGRTEGAAPIVEFPSFPSGRTSNEQLHCARRLITFFTASRKPFYAVGEKEREKRRAARKREKGRPGSPRNE